MCSRVYLFVCLCVCVGECTYGNKRKMLCVHLYNCIILFRHVLSLIVELASAILLSPLPTVLGFQAHEWLNSGCYAYATTTLAHWCISPALLFWSDKSRTCPRKLLCLNMWLPAGTCGKWSCFTGNRSLRVDNPPKVPFSSLLPDCGFSVMSSFTFVLRAFCSLMDPVPSDCKPQYALP